MDAHYHDVQIEAGKVLLIYDLRFEGGVKWFPPSQPDAPPMALRIAERNTVYLVQATGIQYVYDGREFCVLLIEREAPAE